MANRNKPMHKAGSGFLNLFRPKNHEGNPKSGPTSPTATTNTDYLPALNAATTTALEHAIRQIGATCLELEGIYRVSGNSIEVDRIKTQLKGGVVLSEEVLNEMLDKHVLAGAIKKVLNEHEPLLTYRLYDKFIDVVAMDEKDREAKYEELILLLPPTSKGLLDYLIRHLRQISLRASVNKMPVENLAKIFVLALMRKSEVVDVDSMQRVERAKVVVIDLIKLTSLFPDRVESIASKDQPPIVCNQEEEDDGCYQRTLKVTWKLNDGEGVPSEDFVRQEMEKYGGGPVERVGLRAKSALVLFCSKESVIRCQATYPGPWKVKLVEPQRDKGKKDGHGPVIARRLSSQGSNSFEDVPLSVSPSTPSPWIPDSPEPSSASHRPKSQSLFSPITEPLASAPASVMAGSERRKDKKAKRTTFKGIMNMFNSQQLADDNNHHIEPPPPAEDDSNSERVDAHDTSTSKTPSPAPIEEGTSNPAPSRPPADDSKFGGPSRGNMTALIKEMEMKLANKPLASNPTTTTMTRQPSGVTSIDSGAAPQTRPEPARQSPPVVDEAPPTEAKKSSLPPMIKRSSSLNANQRENRDTIPPVENPIPPPTTTTAPTEPEEQLGRSAGSLIEEFEKKISQSTTTSTPSSTPLLSKRPSSLSISGSRSKDPVAPLPDTTKTVTMITSDAPIPSTSKPAEPLIEPERSASSLIEELEKKLAKPATPAPLIRRSSSLNQRETSSNTNNNAEGTTTTTGDSITPEKLPSAIIEALEKKLTKPNMPAPLVKRASTLDDQKDKVKEPSRDERIPMAILPSEPDLPTPDSSSSTSSLPRIESRFNRPKKATTQNSCHVPDYLQEALVDAKRVQPVTSEALAATTTTSPSTTADGPPLSTVGSEPPPQPSPSKQAVSEVPLRRPSDVKKACGDTVNTATTVAEASAVLPAPTRAPVMETANLPSPATSTITSPAPVTTNGTSAPVAVPTEELSPSSSSSTTAATTPRTNMMAPEKPKRRPRKSQLTSPPTSPPPPVPDDHPSAMSERSPGQVSSISGRNVDHTHLPSPSIAQDHPPSNNKAFASTISDFRPQAFSFTQGHDIDMSTSSSPVTSDPTHTVSRSPPTIPSPPIPLASQPKAATTTTTTNSLETPRDRLGKIKALRSELEEQKSRCRFLEERLKQAEDTWEKEFESLRATSTTSLEDLDRLSSELAVVKCHLGVKEAELSEIVNGMNNVVMQKISQEYKAKGAVQERLVSEYKQDAAIANSQKVALEEECRTVRHQYEEQEEQTNQWKIRAKAAEQKLAMLSESATMNQNSNQSSSGGSVSTSKANNQGPGDESQYQTINWVQEAGAPTATTKAAVNEPNGVTRPISSVYVDLGTVYGGEAKGGEGGTASTGNNVPRMTSPLSSSIKIFAALGGAQREMLKTINKEIRRGNRELDAMAAPTGSGRDQSGEEPNRWAQYRGKTHKGDTVLGRGSGEEGSKPLSRSSSISSPNRNIRPGTDLYSREWFGFSNGEGGGSNEYPSPPLTRGHSKRNSLERSDSGR